MTEKYHHIPRRLDRAFFLVLNGDEYSFTYPESKFERFCTYLDSIKRCFPHVAEFVRRIGGFNYDFTEIPVVDDYSIEKRIGGGGQHDVFLLTSKDQNKKPLVLKFDHIRERYVEGRKAALKQVREDYEYTDEVFADVPGLLLPESLIVCASPMRRRSCIAILQPYIEHIRDFREVTIREWEQMFETSPSIRLQVQMVRDAIESRWLRNDILPDLAGQNNLVINGKGLILLDSLPSRPIGSWGNKYREKFKQAFIQLDAIAEL
ncbi:MAG: hypothetical protein ACOX6V_03510 [Patescibacteria group bacterium]|jgi:hypothetical protein